MKYGYNGINEELIRSYKIQDNEIVVTYLDDSRIRMPLTEKNEQNILNKMVQQAKTRNNVSNLKESLQERKISDVITTSFLCSGSVLVSCMAACVDKKMLLTFFGGLGLYNLVTCIARCKSNDEKIKELEKYSLYLSMLEDLMKLKDTQDLYTGIDLLSGDEQININTLDNYSLEDINRLKENLEICKRIDSYCLTNKKSSKK